MKCPKCNGKGTVLKIIYEDWQKDEIVRSAVKCPKCNGSGEVPTNEEWFCNLSTEEKARFLRKIYRDGRDDYVGEWYEQTEADFVEWLKQPHRDKE